MQVSIYIIDNDGNYVYMHRMDGQGWIQIATAEMKARTALMGRHASKERMNRVTRNPLAEYQQIVEQAKAVLETLAPAEPEPAEGQ